MKEALITPNIQVEIREVSVPAPKAGEVLVKVAVAGALPAERTHSLLTRCRYKPQRLESACYLHQTGCELRR
jgi:NADPH:quinone reductase-like Zn-dependent oxidoreductase